MRPRAVRIALLAVAVPTQHSMTAGGGALFVLVPVAFVAYAVTVTVAGLPSGRSASHCPTSRSKREPGTPTAQPTRHGGSNERFRGG